MDLDINVHDISISRSTIRNLNFDPYLFLDILKGVKVFLS